MNEFRTSQLKVGFDKEDYWSAARLLGFSFLVDLAHRSLMLLKAKQKKLGRSQ